MTDHLELKASLAFLAGMLLLPVETRVAAITVLVLLVIYELATAFEET